jgi:hypothetical protein
MIRSSKGQTTVEYIFLLAVVASLAIGVLSSDRFKNFLGINSSIFAEYERYDSYVTEEEPDTRFFLVVNPYGRN